MIQRTILLRHPHRVTAHLDNECFGNRTQNFGRRDPERAFLESREINTRTREGHHRMQGQRQRSDSRGGLENLNAVTTAGVTPELAGVHMARLGESRDQWRKGIIGNGYEDEIGIRCHGRNIDYRHTGQQGLRSESREIGNRRDTRDRMTGPAQCGTQDRPHASRADDAHPQARGPCLRHVAERRPPRPVPRDPCHGWKDAQVTESVLVAIGAARHLPHDRVARVDPRHPLAHAPMQVRVETDGETIVAADPQIGLLNRSVEKLFEARDYRQLMMLANRHDWISPFASEVGVALTLEDAMGITPPECATWTRTLLMELTRISAALLFLGSATADEEALRLRESYVDLQELATGNRVHPMFARIGGIAAPVSSEWLGRVRTLMGRTRSEFTRISDRSHEYAQSLAGIAVLGHSDALAFGATGPVGRASGVTVDLRVQQPYLAYGELTEHLATSGTSASGDAQARYAALLAEIGPSMAVIEACVERIAALGEAPINVALPKVVKAPEGTYYGRIDSPTGISGYLLVSTAEKAPWRFKLRTPSFAHAQSLTAALVGCPIDRLDDALMSFFLVTGDIDR